MRRHADDAAPVARYVDTVARPPRIRKDRIPRGYRGTRKTVEEIKQLVRSGSGDFYVRQKAIDILLRREVRAKDYLGEIRALFEWVQDNIRYTKDPVGIETLHSARQMLALRAGDCDDQTVLLGAMLQSVGHPVRLVLMGRDARRPLLFSHVYLEVLYRGRWIALDPTMPHAVGWTPRQATRRVFGLRRPARPVEAESRRPRLEPVTGSRTPARDRGLLAPITIENGRDRQTTKGD